MTCSKIVGSILLVLGVVIFVFCIDVALKVNAVPLSDWPTSIQQTMRTVQTAAAFACILAACLTIAGGLTIMRSRYAFGSCIAACVVTLALYGLSIATMTHTSVTDVVFILPLLLLCGFGALCSKGYDRALPTTAK